MKIALASQPTLDDSIALNVNRIEKALASLRKKVDLVAFGESYLQGFNSLKWNFERDRTVAVSVDSQPIKMLRYTAKKYSVAVSFGYYELCDEAIYSSYMFIGKNGEIVNNFRRVSKGWKEYDITDEHYKEGDGFKTFTYMGKRIALAVCGDLWYEESIEQINKEKFDFLLYPVYVTYNTEMWRTKLVNEYAEQAKKIPRPVFLVNSICDADNTRGGCYAFLNGKTVCEVPMGQDGYLLVRV